MFWRSAPLMSQVMRKWEKKVETSSWFYDKIYILSYPFLRADGISTAVDRACYHEWRAATSGQYRESRWPSKYSGYFQSKTWLIPFVLLIASDESVQLADIRVSVRQLFQVTTEESQAIEFPQIFNERLRTVKGVLGRFASETESAQGW